MAVAALTGALVQAPDWGWTSARTVALVVLAVGAGLWFFWRSARHPSPLLELHLLRLPRFGTAGLGTLTFNAAFAIMLLSNVLWCQEVWHWSAPRCCVRRTPPIVDSSPSGKAEVSHRTEATTPRPRRVGR